jgi:hypothetical protein
MRDATVGALVSVPTPAIPAAAMAAPVDLFLTAIERNRIAYVAFVASVNPTEKVKAAQEGRVTQADEDAYEASEVEEDASTELVSTVAGTQIGRPGDFAGGFGG